MNFWHRESNPPTPPDKSGQALPGGAFVHHYFLFFSSSPFLAFPHHVFLAVRNASKATTSFKLLYPIHIFTPLNFISIKI